MAQEACLTAYQQLARFRGEATLKTCLLTITWHQAPAPVDRLRDALLLALAGEYTYEELGAMLNAPVGTIKWRVSETEIKAYLSGIAVRRFSGASLASDYLAEWRLRAVSRVRGAAAS